MHGRVIVFYADFLKIFDANTLRISDLSVDFAPLLAHLSAPISVLVFALILAFIFAPHPSLPPILTPHP